jgi:hypothetical protein
LLKDVIGFFTGHNIYAWLFMIVCCVGFGAISMRQKKQSEILSEKRSLR